MSCSECHDHRLFSPPQYRVSAHAGALLVSTVCGLEAVMLSRALKQMECLVPSHCPLLFWGIVCPSLCILFPRVMLKLSTMCWEEGGGKRQGVWIVWQVGSSCWGDTHVPLALLCWLVICFNVTAFAGCEPLPVPRPCSAVHLLHQAAQPRSKLNVH